MDGGYLTVRPLHLLPSIKGKVGKALPQRLWQHSQPLRCSKMIKFTGSPKPADPAHSLFSKLSKLIPKLTAPIPPLGPVGLTENSGRTFNAWTSKPVVLFFHAVLS